MSFYNSGYFSTYPTIAKNVSISTNPDYTVADFLSFFDQFTDSPSEAVIQMFIDMAQQTVMQKRWHTDWMWAMHHYIAHLCTLHLRMTASNGEYATRNDALNTGNAIGLISSESVGDVSVSYDFNQILGGINGYDWFKTTQFGIAFAGKAKGLAKGGMYFV